MAYKISIVRDGEGFEIIGNREGLTAIAEVCLQLAQLPETRAESRRLGNHYHYADWAQNVEADSIPLTILYDPEL
ncbi:MAG: Imm32 family immunity protein [Vicinamibacterales bacterium]